MASDVAQLNLLKTELLGVCTGLSRTPDNPTLLKQNRDLVKAMDELHARCEAAGMLGIGRNGTDMHEAYMTMLGKSSRAVTKRRAPRKGVRR